MRVSSELTITSAFELIILPKMTVTVELFKFYFRGSIGAVLEVDLSDWSDYADIGSFAISYAETLFRV